jgi:PAT family beta-lactamase induction signal transducer AmpG
MGLTASVLGIFFGILVVAIPEVLRARHVPEATVASITAVAVSPAFWSFLVSPVMDVRFTRRWYSMVTAVLAALMTTLALLNLGRLGLLEFSLLAANFFVTLYMGALGGWLSSIVAEEARNRLSAWMYIGNAAAGGLTVAIAVEALDYLPTSLAALVLGAALLLPCAVFPWMPAPEVDGRLAGESFRKFFGELASLVRRREVLVVVLLFVAPTATFALNNIVGGLGPDFHASRHLVGLIGGIGITLGGIAGSYGFRLIDRLLPLRFLYLGVGVLGALFNLAVIMLPRTPGTFATAMIAENLFMFLSMTVQAALIFDTVGRDNPLAATTFSVLFAAPNVPITYMLYVDAWGYNRGGVAGSFGADVGASIIACVMMAAFLLWLSKRIRPEARALAQADG